MTAKYLHNSNRFFILQSEFKGVERISVVDMVTKEVRMLKIPNQTCDQALRQGDYILMQVFEDTLVINYSDINTPPKIYCVHFKQILAEGQTLSQLVDAANLDVNILEELSLTSPGDEFGRFYHDHVKSIKQDYVLLENGAEALVLWSGSLAPDKKHPMLVIVHGGPFSCSPYQLFLPTRQTLLMQGYVLLILNFRGSIGYGEDLMNSLLSNIGVNDV